jgi:hypothetical protein
MKQAIIVFSLAAAAVLAAVLVSVTGVLEPVLNRDPNQLTPEQVREVYEEEIREYRSERDARIQAEEAEGRDPFGRELLRDSDHRAVRIAEALAESEAVCTQADLDEWTAELVPIIQRITGWTFEEAPAVQIADRAAIIDPVGADTGTILYGPLGQTVEARRHYGALQSAFLLGHYGLQSGETLVVATNLRPLLGHVLRSDDELRNAAKLVLAHGLAHALQNQFSPLQHQLRSENVYEVATVHAAFEGHAALIEELVAAELGLAELSLTLRASLSDHSTCFGFGGVREFADGVPLDESFSVGAARDFMAHHLAEGGHERLREIIMSPPRRTSSILNPPEWKAEPRQLPTVLISTAVTDFITSSGFEKIDDQSSTNRAYQEAIQRLDAAGQEVVTRTSDGAYMGLFVPADKRGYVVIFAHRFRDPADSIKWYESAIGSLGRLQTFTSGREDMAVESASDEALECLEEIKARRIRHVQFVRGRGRARFDESFSVVDRMGIQLLVQAAEVDEEFHRSVHGEMWKYYRFAVLGEDEAVDGIQ